MSESAPRRLTYEDLANLDPDNRWELIDGVPYAMAGCSLVHQVILREFSFHLTLHFRKTPCQVLSAPFDVKFSPYDVVQPDLLVACGEGLKFHLHEGPPELVIEIASPSTLRHDRLRKLRLYAQSGVREYWLITPHPFLVEVLENVDGAYVMRAVYAESDRLQSVRFPDLQVALQEIAAALPPQPPIPDEVREYAPAYAGGQES